jgi:hypothetical protein
MGLRFQRRVTLFPGVRLNFSKNGISTSLGPRGATVSVGKRGTFLNVGLPGTGLSYRTRIDSPVISSPAAGTPGGRVLPALLAAVVILFLGYLLSSARNTVPDATDNAAPHSIQSIELNGHAEKKAPDPISRAVYVARAVVNIRASGSTAAAIVGRASKGDELHVFEDNDGWLLVGQSTPIGWVRTDLVTLSP